MTKYVLADMVNEKLEMLETVLPSGKARFEAILYQSATLKKITVSKRSLSESTASTVLMTVRASEYDLPFTIVDIAFDSADNRLTATFNVRLLVNDGEDRTRIMSSHS